MRKCEVWMIRSFKCMVKVVCGGVFRKFVIERGPAVPVRLGFFVVICYTVPWLTQEVN